MNTRETKPLPEIRPRLLRLVRVTQNVSLEELGNSTGLDPGKLEKWERGFSSPSKKEKNKLSSFFEGYDPDELLQVAPSHMWKQYKGSFYQSNVLLREDIQERKSLMYDLEDFM